MTASARIVPVSVSPWLSVLVFGVWVAGAYAGRWVGVWGGVGSAALITAAVAVLGVRRGLAPLLRPTVPLVLQGVAAGAVMIAATYLLFPLVVRLSSDVASATAALYELFNSGPALLRLILLAPVIFCEELVWRGLVQGTLAAKPRARAALLSAGIYALAHLPLGSPLLAVIALACGVYWGLLRAYTGSLIPVLVAHLLWDLAVMVLFPLS
ncbi:MAG: protease [Armatimonadetes bacterium]|jgi:membrane protease YdiL (CAAX protease family)|nr:protease [Armatimonadota bacterium]